MNLNAIPNDHRRDNDEEAKHWTEQLVHGNAIELPQEARKVLVELRRRRPSRTAGSPLNLAHIVI
jgi:hypothetical protein